jgi:hypothetical protein
MSFLQNILDFGTAHGSDAFLFLIVHVGDSFDDKYAGTILRQLRLIDVAAKISRSGIIYPTRTTKSTQTLWSKTQLTGLDYAL